MMPLPHRSVVGVVVDVVVVLGSLVVLVDPTVVVVVVGASPGHSAKSIWQSPVQRSAPLGED
jgi:hypothetical protein